MSLILSPEEIRVLGVLIEKDMATPEYYPMSPNALMNGCNQKTNRDPMTSFPEHIVSDTLDSLRARNLVSALTGGSNRVPKWSHRVSEILNLSNREMAVMCVLMLRGAQTLNEIKTRTESLYKFDDHDAVENTLNKLADRGMTLLLPKPTGAREPRWTHLLLGEPVLPSASASLSSEPAGALTSPLAERVAALEAELASLREEFDAFRKQLE